MSLLSLPAATSATRCCRSRWTPRPTSISIAKGSFSNQATHLRRSSSAYVGKDKDAEALHQMTKLQHTRRAALRGSRTFQLTKLAAQSRRSIVALPKHQGSSSIISVLVPTIPSPALQLAHSGTRITPSHRPRRFVKSNAARKTPGRITPKRGSL